MFHKVQKVKYARQSLESLYGINTITSKKIIGLLELHPHAFERHLFQPKRARRLRYILASLRINFKLRLIVFSRICLQIKLGTTRGLRLGAGLPSHGQRTHANGKTSKRRILLPFRFKKYGAPASKEKREPRKNVKKKMSRTKQKKLARPKQKVKKKKKE